MINYIFLLLMIVFTVAAQLLIKKGVGISQASEDYISILKGFINIYVALGFFLVMIAPVFYILALRGIELSKAFAFSSANYALVVMGGRIFFKEKVNSLRWVGVAMIISGVICFGTT